MNFRLLLVLFLIIVTLNNSYAQECTSNANLIIHGPTNFCGSATLKASEGFKTYLWSTGATTQTITVNTIGNYAVTVTDHGGCTAIAENDISDFTSYFTASNDTVCVDETADIALTGFPPVIFEKHRISPIETDFNIESVRNAVSADLNGDEKKDIISASDADKAIVWYENDGNQNFSPHFIATDLGDPIVYATDMNNDNVIDVLSASGDDDKIFWHENDGSGCFTKHLVADEFNLHLQSIHPEDIDEDGDKDIIVAFFFMVVWYENIDGENFTQHIVFDNTQGFVYSIHAADINNDGNMDIVSGSASSGLAWHENNGNEVFSTHNILSTHYIRELIFCLCYRFK